MPATQFGSAILRVLHACDTESSRYALGGVLFEVSREHEKCWVVATDGRRLHLAEMGLPFSRDVDESFSLIPEKAAWAIHKLASDGRHKESSIDLQASDSDLVADFGTITVTARLLSGRFPDWRKVLGGDRAGEQVTTVNREELLSSTRAAAIVTTEQSKGVVFALKTDEVLLHVDPTEAGESSVTVQVVKGPESPVTVNLDPRFVSDWLKVLTAEDDPNVTIHVVDAESSAVLRCDSCTGVIMPLARD
jgi:DNA polymerase-3 subunit beta